MRAVIVVGVLLCSSVTWADEPEVPPRSIDEPAPAEAPNYFAADELGAGAVAVYAGCQSTFATSPDVDAQAVAKYCSCFAETARANVPFTGFPRDPTISRPIGASKSRKACARLRRAHRRLRR